MTIMMSTPNLFKWAVELGLHCQFSSKVVPFWVAIPLGPHEAGEISRV